MAVALVPRTRPIGVATTERSLVAACLALLLIVGVAGGGVLVVRTRPAMISLHASGIAIGAGGHVVQLQPGDALVPGTRVLAGQPDSLTWAAEQASWLLAGEVPEAPGVDPSLVRGALLDLHVLAQTDGVPVAGWTGAWRYVWPRDAALCAVALARTGHLSDAERILAFLQRVQPESGVFQARYRPDGSGVPDGRGAQLDGVGWALWALAETASRLPPAQQAELVDRHAGLLRRSTDAALAATATPYALPVASPDYWEVTEQTTTLATAALLKTGLVAASSLWQTAGDPTSAEVAAAAASRLDRAIKADFGPDGYPRRHGGRSDSVDLGAAFLLPPYADRADPEVVSAWREGAVVMARPSGGLAPGGSWRRDGISWTNATASYAMTAAALGEDDEARRWLDWLAAHRTATGALPEKVRADGAPASVAPLAWTAAAVVISAELLSS